MDLGFTPESFKTHFLTADRRQGEAPKIAAAS